MLPGVLFVVWGRGCGWPFIGSMAVQGNGLVWRPDPTFRAQKSLPLRGRWHGEAVTEGVCMGLALVGENGGTPCGETPCGGTPSVSAGGAASSLREGALGFCPTDSPSRAAPAKREVFRFDALQTPAQTNCARRSHSGFRRSFRRALVGTNCTT